VVLSTDAKTSVLFEDCLSSSRNWPSPFPSSQTYRTWACTEDTVGYLRVSSQREADRPIRMGRDADGGSSVRPFFGGTRVASSMSVGVGAASARRLAKDIWKKGEERAGSVGADTAVPVLTRTKPIDGPRSRIRRVTVDPLDAFALERY
jgi:hypothetical protein